jgi:hypothetical protein
MKVVHHRQNPIVTNRRFVELDVCAVGDRAYAFCMDTGSIVKETCLDVVLMVVFVNCCFTVHIGYRYSENPQLFYRPLYRKALGAAGVENLLHISFLSVTHGLKNC